MTHPRLFPPARKFMCISLVGMAGTGKSFWAKRLARRGFKRYCCDDLIGRRLRRHLIGLDGNAVAMGEWMGFPWEPHYPEREALYLDCEKKVLQRVFDALEAGRDQGKPGVVVDTTGSVIYTGETLLARLKRLTTVVHLSTPGRVKETMLKAYVEKPRPVLWMGTYRKRPGETDRETLVRCYGILLNKRERLYRRISDVTVGFSERRRITFGVSEFLDRITTTMRRGCLT